jgi:hypothetical protein
MERAGWYRMNYTPADAARALCGPFGMCIPDERQRNISQARDLAGYFLEVAAHLEHPGLRVEE